MEFIPYYLTDFQEKQAGDLVTASEWNNIINALITQANRSAQALVDISKTYSTKTYTNTQIGDKIVEISAGDMAKAIYDTNNDGIVNQADTVTDNAITTSKIINEAVTPAKLSPELQTLLATLIGKATNIKMGKVSDLTVSSTEQGNIDSRTTTNSYDTYNIGFTPTAVLIFKYDTHTQDYGSSYIRENGFVFAEFETWKFYSYSSYADETYAGYGGIALTDQPAEPIKSSYAANIEELFRIVVNGFRLHRYYYNYEDNSGDKQTVSSNFNDSYYIAIG